MLVTNNLTKKYSKRMALNNFSVQIDSGQIVGILGPNGSGKSTLMKIAAGLIPKSDGDIEVVNTKPGALAKSKISYLADSNAIPDTMKVKEVEDFYKTFYDDFNVEVFRENLIKLRLSKEMKTKVKKLSKGMQQKLRLALTMARKAELYLLDEPLGGIDPLAREEILETLITTLDESSTLVITTHLVNDVEQILNRVVFIHEGKNIGEYDCEALRYEEGVSISDKYKEVFRYAEAN